LRERYLEGGFNVRAQDWFAASTARIDLLHGLEQTVAGNISNLSARHQAAAQNALVMTSSISLLAILLTVIASVWIGRGISNPLKKLIAMAEFIDKNDDFTRHVDTSGVQEVQRTASAFNSLIDKFRHILGEARRSSEELASASHTIN
ncbi:methyl-accepting chemotaxis protein, partial [Arthrospira platensis SPKY2]